MVELTHREGDFGGDVLESMALWLISLALDDNAERDMILSRIGNSAHMRICDAKGDLALEVTGQDSDELGNQLALACLHNISIEHLGALHLKPLKRALQVRKGGNDRR